MTSSPRCGPVQGVATLQQGLALEDTHDVALCQQERDWSSSPCSACFKCYRGRALPQRGELAWGRA